MKAAEKEAITKWLQRRGIDLNDRRAVRDALRPKAWQRYGHTLQHALQRLEEWAETTKIERSLERQVRAVCVATPLQRVATAPALDDWGVATPVATPAKPVATPVATPAKPVATPVATPAKPVATPVATKLSVEAQQALDDAAYDAGKADGLAGSAPAATSNEQYMYGYKAGALQRLG